MIGPRRLSTFLCDVNSVSNRVPLLVTNRPLFLILEATCVRLIAFGISFSGTTYSDWPLHFYLHFSAAFFNINM